MAKSNIVFYEFCGCATLFKSEQKAIVAAAEESKRRGYKCEHFFCEKEHSVSRNNHDNAGVGWHVRSVRWH